MNSPDPTNQHPMAGFPQVCFIRNVVANPNIIEKVSEQLGVIVSGDVGALRRAHGN